MLSKQVKERIRANKMRRRMRYPIRVRVIETGECLLPTEALSDYQKAAIRGGYRKGQLVIFGGRRKPDKPFCFSNVDDFQRWVSDKPVADLHLGQSGEFTKLVDEQMTLRLEAKARYLAERAALQKTEQGE